MKEIHDPAVFRQILVNLFKELIHICDQYNLKYFCLGGTLIGAVRHQGLIPWDDDIDVAMPRDDYDRFLELYEADSQFSLITPELRSDYNLTFAKLYNNKTKLREKGTHCIIGLYLDVFPLDGIGNNLDAQRESFIRYRDLAAKIRNTTLRGVDKIKDFIFGIRHNGLLVSIPFIIKSSFSKRAYRKDLLLQYKNFVYLHDFDSSEYIVNYGGAWGEKEIIPKYVFEEYILMDFENIQVRIPKYYDVYLKSLYGDYMRLPPEDKRISHHDFDILELPS